MPRRAAFTMIELMVAMMIMGIVAAFGVPRLTDARDRGLVRSAKQQIGGYLATARAGAIRRGLRANFTVKADTLSVWIQESAGAPTQIGPKVPLAESYGVALTSPVDSIVYDARGFAVNLASTQKFIVRKSGYSDSLCVTRLGMISTKCGL